MRRIRRTGLVLFISLMLVLGLVGIVEAKPQAPDSLAAPAEQAAGATLPGRGIVIFTFADTYGTAYTKAYPALKARGWRGVAWISPTKVGDANKLTLPQLTELNRQGWDISSHGWTHAHAINLSGQALTDHLKLAHDWLIAKGFVRGAQHYNPPYGDCDQRVLREAVKYYTTIKQDSAGVCQRLPSGFTYTVGYSDDAYSLDKVEKPQIDALTNNSQVLFIGFHRIVDANAKNIETSVARMNRLFDYAKSRGVNVMTMSEFLDYANGKAPISAPSPDPGPVGMSADQKVFLPSVQVSR